jgi:HAD superfamily hydrolase (TIGR01490 family)
MESSGKSYVAFFDLDKTIIGINSGSLLVWEAYKNGAMSTGNLINAIFQSSLYKFNLRDTNLIILKMGTWLKGLPFKNFDELSVRVVNKYLIGSIRPEMIKEIDLHKEKNAAIVILSSAISTICEPIGRHLGVDDNICTSMEVTGGFLTGAPAGRFCFGDEKRIRLLSYCRINQYNPAEAWYYADSISDLPAFEVVGNPVCVTPDKKLRKTAVERGWRVF